MTDAGPVLLTCKSARGVTAVLLVEASLVGSVSVVVVVPVAVFDSPLVTPEPTCTTRVKVALAPAARLERVSVTVPLLPTAGVVDPKDGPLPWDSDTNDGPAGSVSTTALFRSSLGPLLLTVTV